MAARALGPEAYAPISVLWSAVFLVTATIWIPVEQEVARLVGSRAARGEGARPVARAGARAAIEIGAPGVALVALVAIAGDGSLFDGRTGVAVALVVAVAAFAPNHLTRAALAGSGSFGRYGLCIALDSATRLGLAVALALAGVDDPVPYALAVAIAPLVPVVAFRRQWQVAAAPGPPSPPLRPHVLPLVGGQALAQVLVNGGPIAVALLAAPGEEAAAGRFLAALLIARIPLFFFQAVQSSLLPGLARLEAVGDRAGFIDLVRRLTALVVGLGVLAVAGSWALGPWAVRLGFGPAFALGRRDLALLAAAAGAVMLAHVLAHAAIALAGHVRVTAGWAVGVAVAAVVLAAGDDLVLRVELALVAGSLAAAGAHGTTLRRRLAGWSATG
ncbi:polysaccharide biosynthesis protein [Acidimicrobiia bacterium EGI L10123]|uniref:polysaccharide biosynthesis protein n=1 Tax=Salinilacustrithrix flava TaxID=2957203 RepID=UPI003D7C25E3|nr:polysaccharide biosynthesis protein [Acidimicrobiia bacterium EGI L10123]